jgi:hypothetical protein
MKPLPPAAIQRLRRIFFVSMGVMLAIPVLAAAFLAISAPRYYALFIKAPLGWLLVGLAVLLELVAAAATWQVGYSPDPGWVRRQRIASLFITAVFVFPVMAIVALGPAIVLLLKLAR